MEKDERRTFLVAAHARASRVARATNRGIHWYHVNALKWAAQKVGGLTKDPR